MLIDEAPIFKILFKVDLTKWPLEQTDEILQKLVDLIPPL